MQMTGERYALLYHISALGLAVYDTILYLDTHECEEARGYLIKRREEYYEAVAKYEEKYGPLSFSGHPDKDVCWAWQMI